MPRDPRVAAGEIETKTERCRVLNLDTHPAIVREIFDETRVKIIAISGRATSIDSLISASDSVQDANGRCWEWIEPKENRSLSPVTDATRCLAEYYQKRSILLRVMFFSFLT